MKHLSIQFFYISTWTVFFYQKYIYYEKSDRFPRNGGNQCGSAPVHHYIFSSVCGFPSRYLLRLTNQDSKSWTSVFCITLRLYVCSRSFGISEQQKKRFSLYYLSRDVSMKKYLCATENTCRYFQYSLEVILNSILYLFQFLCSEWRLLRLLVFISRKVVYYRNIYKSWAFSSSLYDLH